MAAPAFASRGGRRSFRRRSGARAQARRKPAERGGHGIAAFYFLRGKICMPSPREYREHLYRLKTHPEEAEGLGADGRDSFLRVYLSILPFGALEVFLERSLTGYPAGLVFPIAYLL